MEEEIKFQNYHFFFFEKNKFNPIPRISWQLLHISSDKMCKIDFFFKLIQSLF